LEAACGITLETVCATLPRQSGSTWRPVASSNNTIEACGSFDSTALQAEITSVALPWAMRRESWNAVRLAIMVAYPRMAFVRVIFHRVKSKFNKFRVNCR